MHFHVYAIATGLVVVSALYGWVATGLDVMFVPSDVEIVSYEGLVDSHLDVSFATVKQQGLVHEIRCPSAHVVHANAHRFDSKCVTALAALDGTTARIGTIRNGSQLIVVSIESSHVLYAGEDVVSLRNQKIQLLASVLGVVMGVFLAPPVLAYYRKQTK